MASEKQHDTFQLISCEVHKILSCVQFITDSYDRESREEAVKQCFSESLHRINLLLRCVKRLSVDDFVADDAADFKGPCFSLFDFRGYKRKALKNVRVARKSLRKAEKFLLGHMFFEVEKFLFCAIEGVEDAFYFLKKINLRLNTAYDTAKTVQIQIQQEKKKM